MVKLRTRYTNCGYKDKIDFENNISTSKFINVHRASYLFCSVLFLIFCLKVYAGNDEKQYSFPYKLSLKTELTIAPISISSFVAGQVLKKNMTAPQEAEILALDKNNVNRLDRKCIMKSSESAASFSDVTSMSLYIAAPGLLTIPPLMSRKWFNLFVVAVMYSEAMFLTSGVTHIVKVTVSRDRPYLYNPNKSMEEKLDEGSSGRRSFFSAHTSMTFCSALFVTKVFSDSYPHLPWKYVIGGGSITLAAITGIMRVEAG